MTSEATGCRALPVRVYVDIRPESHPGKGWLTSCTFRNARGGGSVIPGPSFRSQKAARDFARWVVEQWPLQETHGCRPTP